MKAACIVLTILISIAIMAVCVMVKFATDITVEERKREYAHSDAGIFQLTRSMGVISLSENHSQVIGDRFPYVAAIIKNSSSSWSFACFASIILGKWAVTAAHCRTPGSTHRLLLFHDYSRNFTHTYPVLFWRLHEMFDLSNPTPKYDIAVAKLNLDTNPFTMKSSLFDAKEVSSPVDVSVWKTVSTMEKKMYLTNEFDKFEGEIVAPERCFENYGTQLDESLICVDFSHYRDCFINEFGPIYAGDKVVGILSVKPKDCDVKLTIFTNVSYYAHWILKSTHTTYYG